MDDKKDWNQAKKEFAIGNDYVFCRIMKSPEVLTEFIRMCYPNRTFNELLYVARQHVVEVGKENKSIRMDIKAEDSDGTVYDVEMQNKYQKDNIERRIRYYAALLDCDTIKPGDAYEFLPDVFIIFVCSFDYKNQGQVIYDFSKRDEYHPSIQMGDGQHIILLNCTGNGTFPKGDYEKLSHFVQYVHTNIPTDDFTTKIHNMIAECAKDPAEREDFMEYMDKFWDFRKEIHDKEKEIADSHRLIDEKNKMLSEKDEEILALRKRVQELEANRAN